MAISKSTNVDLFAIQVDLSNLWTEQREQMDGDWWEF